MWQSETKRLKLITTYGRASDSSEDGTCLGHKYLGDDRAGRTRAQPEAPSSRAPAGKRGRLLVFGCDTHGANWNNAVHEFDPVKVRWTTYYPPAGPNTYRANDHGRAVAGTDRRLPRTTHVYDNTQYDPARHALLIGVIADHKPARKTVPGVSTYPHFSEQGTFTNRTRRVERFQRIVAYDRVNDHDLAFQRQRRPAHRGDGRWARPQAT